MQLTINLGYVKNAPGFVTIPYWFTTDRSIYLNYQQKSITVNLHELTDDTLHDIAYGIMNGDIIVSDLEAFKQFYQKKFSMESTQDIKEPVVKTQQDVAELKEKILIEKAVHLLELSQADLSALLFEANKLDTDDLEILDEYNEYCTIEILQKALELENERSKPRKGIVKLLKDKLKELEANAVTVSNEPLIEGITEEIDKILIVTEDNKLEELKSNENN